MISTNCHRIYWVFPSKAVARTNLGGALKWPAAPVNPNPLLPPPSDPWPMDGWLTIDSETGEKYYWNIDVVFQTGEVWAPTGSQILDPILNILAPVLAKVAGYHVNGLWSGPMDKLPTTLNQYRVTPSTPICKFE